MTNIALVDDESNILTSVSLALETEGFNVDTFNNGEAAMKGLENKKYDYLPFSESLQKKIIPIYKVFEGWNSSTFGLTKWSDLPIQAKNYISTIEKIVETKISISCS